jgi:hypothetical protein
MGQLFEKTAPGPGKNFLLRGYETPFIFFESPVIFPELP